MGKDESTSKHSSSKHKHSHRDRSREKDTNRDREDKHKSRQKHDRGPEDETKHSKHRSRKKGSDDEGVEKKHKKHRTRDSDDEEKHRKHKHRRKEKESVTIKDKEFERKVNIVDDDGDDSGMWVEKDIAMDGERVLATNIPTADSLRITSSAEEASLSPQLPPTTHTGSTLKRDDWMLLPSSTPVVPSDGPSSSSRRPLGVGEEESMTEEYGDTSEGARTLGGGVDFFSSLGTEMKRKNAKPDRPNPDQLKISSRELNQDLKEGKPLNFDEPLPPPKTITPGGPGSSWRMMRLRKVYETAEEEGVPIETVALDRFGSLSAFEEAKEERRILDERDGKRSDRDRDWDRGRPADRQQARGGQDGEKRLMFTEIGESGGSSRSSSFRRPGGAGGGGGNNMARSGPSTPSPQPDAGRPLANKRLDSLRLPSQAGSPLQQSHTPIPSVMTPPPRASGSGSGGGRGLSPSSLNRLQAKVLRAKLMGAADAEKLEKEYDIEVRRANGGGGAEGGVRKVEVLPTLDARGRLYDVGHGKADDVQQSGNRKKKEPKFETHRKTGEVIRINADDDDLTLGEMLRQEKFGAGMADQKDLDAQYARAIMGDGKYQNDLDYIDENAEKLGRQKMRSDAMKRQFAIHDYKRTQKALSSCNFCYGEDDSLPKAPVVAMGTRVYLSCTVTEELVPGHCLIVPIQHHLNMLEGDDDVWDEVQNFMKCLMRMFAEEDKGVAFYETVISLKKQKHTCIECVPMPWEFFDLIPGYFKESILASEAEWSQHKKLIDFGARPGGFRRAMVPDLPYFMVQFDHKGEKGYGHVIEGAADAGEDEDGLEEGEKGGGEFPPYFASEIIGNVLEIEARRWRRPKRIDFRSNKERVAGFRKKYDKFDWTGMIGRP